MQTAPRRALHLDLAAEGLLPAPPHPSCITLASDCCRPRPAPLPSEGPGWQVSDVSPRADILEIYECY